MKFVVLGLLVVFVIGFFVVIWKAAANWRWYQIAAAVCVMLLAAVFPFPTAMVLKSRSAWHQIKEQLEVRLAREQADQQRLKYGDAPGASAAAEGQGVIALSRQLAKLDMEAGRRGRNATLQSVGDDLTITLAAEDPAAGLPAAATGDRQEAAAVPLATAGMIVYGFAESPNPDQLLVPASYLGEYLVTAATPTSVTIKPTGPLEPAQVEAIQNRQATSWSLYELLPIDGHEMFLAPGSAPSDDNFLGRVDEELVRRLLGDRVSPETLQSYLRDGSRSTPDDPPPSRWTKIEFEKPFTFDVDSQEQRSALDGGFFDGSGRAVDGRLQKGEEVKFSSGDQIVLKEEAANRLIDEGVARLVDQYYLRPLNDYRYILRRIRLRLTELANQMDELRYEQEVLQLAADKTQQLLVVNQDIKLKLEQDFAHFRTEKQAIEQYLATVQQQLAEMRDSMKQLHRENRQLERRLESYHRAIMTDPPRQQGLAVVN